jgi:hypothetical protein
MNILMLIDENPWVHKKWERLWTIYFKERWKNYVVGSIIDNSFIVNNGPNLTIQIKNSLS